MRSYVDLAVIKGVEPVIIMKCIQMKVIYVFAFYLYKLMSRACRRVQFNSLFLSAAYLF